MANQIRPLARLFRGMADLIDHDHTSPTRYEAIAKVAGVVAARATAQELVAGRLWQVDGADLLAAAYAFHAGLPRQAATAAHVQAMQQPGPAPAGVQRQPPTVAPVPPGRPGMGNPEAATTPPVSPASSIAAPLDPHRLPGPRLGDLDPADVAKLWALLSELPGGQVIPRGQLIRLTGVIPADLAARLLRLLDGGPELVRGQAARIGNGIDPNDPATPGSGRGRAGLAGSCRTGPGRREQLPGAAGPAQRGRPARPATLAATRDAPKSSASAGRRQPRDTRRSGLTRPPLAGSSFPTEHFASLPNQRQASLRISGRQLLRPWPR